MIGELQNLRKLNGLAYPTFFAPINECTVDNTPFQDAFTNDSDADISVDLEATPIDEEMPALTESPNQNMLTAWMACSCCASSFQTISTMTCANFTS